MIFFVISGSVAHDPGSKCAGCLVQVIHCPTGPWLRKKSTIPLRTFIQQALNFIQQTHAGARFWGHSREKLGFTPGQAEVNLHVLLKELYRVCFSTID
jgi:hypothetical protein